jgi:putative tricarboxylic transport membrane protein
MTRDGIAGLICLALTIGLLLLTRGLPQSSFVPMGPEFYSRIVLVIMAALSVMLVASDLWRQRTQSAAAGEGPAPEKRNYLLLGMTFAVFAGYVVLLPLVGYRIATFLFMTTSRMTWWCCSCSDSSVTRWCSCAFRLRR